MKTLTRQDMDRLVFARPRTAKGTRPDLKLIRVDDLAVAVKDYRHSDRLFRGVVAPILIRRERGALEKLENVDGVPRLVGSPDRHALLMECVDGRALREIEKDSLDTGFFDELEDLVKRMHLAGVAHCDLRTGGNIMVDGHGHPHLIDFASCVFRGRGLNPLITWLFKQFCQADLFAVVLAKKRVSPGLLSSEDEKTLQRSLPFERPAIFIGKLIRKLTRRLLTHRRR